MTLKIYKTCLKWLQKHRSRRKIIKAKVLKTTRARTRVSVTSENNTCMCTCCFRDRAEKASCYVIKAMDSV